MRAPRAASAVAVTATLLAASAVAAVPSASPKAETIPPLAITRSPDFPDPAPGVADIEHWYRVDAVHRWAAEVERQQAEARADAARRAAARATRGVRRSGPLPPASVKACESGGNYQAQNRRSSASGAWQIVDGTWGGYGGYAHAKDAPPAVQDAKAAELWAGGAGASHWRACL